MMITLNGLPPSTQYADVKELIIWKCNISDYILDSMEDCADGTKKVRVGLVDDTEAKRLVKCLDGYRWSGHVLKAVTVSKSSKCSTTQQISYDPLKFFKQRQFLLPNPEEDRRPINNKSPPLAQRANQKSNHAENHYGNQANNQYSNQANNKYSNQANNIYNNQARNQCSNQADIHSNCANNQYSNQANNMYSNQANNSYNNQADIHSNCADNIYNNQPGNHYNNQAENHYSHQNYNQPDIQLNNQGHSNQQVPKSTCNSQPRAISYDLNSRKSGLPEPGLLFSRSDDDISRRDLSRPLETVQDRHQAPQGAQPSKKKLSGAGRRRLALLKAKGKLSSQETCETCQKPWSASSVERPNVPKPLNNNLERGRFEQEFLYEQNQRGKCDGEPPNNQQRGRFEEESHYENQKGRCDEESPYKHQIGRFEKESPYKHQKGRCEENLHYESQRGRHDEESPYKHQRGRFEEDLHYENQRGRCDEEPPYKRGRIEEEYHYENQRGRCDEEPPYKHQRGRIDEEYHYENQRGRCDEEPPYKRGRIEEEYHNENQRGRCDEEPLYKHQRGRIEEEYHYENQRGRFEQESRYENQSEASIITPVGFVEPPPKSRDVTKGYPRVGIRNYEPMTTEQMTLVNAAISSTISQISRSVGIKGSGPKFHGVQYKAGWLLITCEDRESQEWLMNEVPKCRPWPEARLSVMEERELPTGVPRPWTAATYIPLTEAGSASEAMELIGYQNKGLYPELWKIFCERVTGGHIFAIFSLDEYSAETLLNGDCKVYIGMKRLLFKLRTKTYKSLSKPGNVSAGEESSKGPSRLENDFDVPGRRGLGCSSTECSSMDNNVTRSGGLGGEKATGQIDAGDKKKRKRKRRKERNLALASASNNHHTD